MAGPQTTHVGEFALNRVYSGDCLDLLHRLPPNCIDVVVTSPPYWGQRTSGGVGVEDDPRAYLQSLLDRFVEVQRVLKPSGLVWLNLGDAYNTPVNWRFDDHKYSSLGPDRAGLGLDNSAYVKPRHKRKAFELSEVSWLQYGNLLALPYRLVIGLCDRGYLFRGEVIWMKSNPMPEGKCRRPHRAHEGLYLLAKSERHAFRIAPPVRSVWELANEGPNGIRHFSRFPLELPQRCIQAYGRMGSDVVVLDPFSGSGTTGTAALGLGCSYLGFEIEPELARQSNDRLAKLDRGILPAAPPSTRRREGRSLFDE